MLVVYVGDVGALTLVPYHKGNTEAEYYTENQTTTSRAPTELLDRHQVVPNEI